jgi:spore coat polysaccharide biosynthesis protein SpsF
MTDLVVAVIQARMSSTRLPGKSLKMIGDWSLIEMVLNRVNKATKVDNIVLATSTNAKDDTLEEHVKQLGFPVYRGSEEDVLSRFFNAAKSFNPTTVVRITGDCPLISPTLIDHAIELFNKNEVDYLSLSIGEEKEKAYPRGLDVEIANFKSMTEAVENATEQYEREHVMPYLYTRPGFTTAYPEPDPESSRPLYRLCVDTEVDFELILRIFDNFKGRLIDTDYKEIIQFLDDNPEIAKLNRSVTQKHFKDVETNEEQ